MECGENVDALLEFAAGRLDNEAGARLEAHLETCAACREYVGGLRAVWQSLDAWEAPPVSADFDRRLNARIAQEVSWWDRLLMPFRPALVRRGLPIAAAAVVVVMAGIAVDRSTAVKAVPEKASIQLESLRPDQAERAIQDLELIDEINGPVAPDSGASAM